MAGPAELISEIEATKGDLLRFSRVAIPAAVLAASALGMGFTAYLAGSGLAQNVHFAETAYGVYFVLEGQCAPAKGPSETGFERPQVDILLIPNNDYLTFAPAISTHLDRWEMSTGECLPGEQ